MKSKILIVDDDRTMLDMMKQTLGPYYEVLSAASGSEALRLLRSAGTAGAETPDLIRRDIDMPIMHGYEVLERMNCDEELKKIPVVFLTGLTDEQAEMKGLSKNVLDYLKKPVGMRVLLMRVQHYLNLTAAGSDTGALEREMLASLPESLTDREQEVARLMAQFRSDREISEMLNISMPYAKKLVGIVKEKLGLEKRGDIRRFIRK